MKKSRKYIKIFIIALITLMFICKSESVQAAGASIEEDKNAIVEVQVGLESYSGDFYKVKSASGFVIYNQAGGAYVVTTNHTVNVSDKEKKRVCKKKGIDSSLSGLSVKIRVMVEGDVSTNVEIKANSKQDDFCVLEAGDVLNKKSVLHIDDSKEYSIGNDIYVLGYSSSSVKKGAYSIEDVEIHKGLIQDTSAGISDGRYIQHSAIILPEQSGGPVLNKDGYVIGMANSAITSKKTDIYYALPIEKIKSILDNYGISYESREKDIAFNELKKSYKRCQQKLNSGEYKNSSGQLLESAISKTSELFEQKEYSISDIESANKLLKTGEKSLVKKISKILILKYILLAIFLIALIRMIIKLVYYYKMKKKVFTDEEKQDRIISEYESEETVNLRKTYNTLTPGRNLMNVDLDTFDPTRAVLLDQLSGNIMNISKKECRIGKNPDNDLQINSNVISRNHALIYWKDGNYYIKDLDSANGTFLNGRELEDVPSKLKNQDLITFANVEMKFEEREVK